MQVLIFSRNKKRITILALALLVTGILASGVFTRSRNNALADTPTATKKQETVNNLNAEIAIAVSLVVLISAAVKIVADLNAVENRIKDRLSDVEKGLSADILLKHEGVAKDLVAIRQEVFAIQSQFQLAIVDLRQELMKVNHKFETAMITSDSNYELMEKEYVNLQREVQNVLRQLHYRLADLESFSVKEHDFKPRNQQVNLDIEGI
jgi:hypothetical protein